MDVVNLLVSALGGVLGAGGFLCFAGKFFADKGIEYYKNKYQKALQDYNLYSLKRNEVYAEVYKLANICYANLPSYGGRINTPELSTETEKSERYYEHCETPIRSFNNYRLLNELYFEVEVQAKIDSFYSSLWSLHHICYARYLHGTSSEEEPALRALLDSTLIEVRDLMRKHIGSL